MQPRRAEKRRETRETKVEVRIDLDGAGRTDCDTGLPFLDHMLDLLGRHALWDLAVKAQGDLRIDAHHTVEDVGITLGQALGEALGDKAGILRFAAAKIPMGEARADVCLDVCGRFHLVFEVPFPQGKTGDFDTALIEDFFHALAEQARLTLHVVLEAGRNDHHIAEAVFKGVAHCFYQALYRDGRKSGVPSTKGVL